MERIVKKRKERMSEEEIGEDGEEKKGEDNRR